jgi:hypothetical protein
LRHHSTVGLVDRADAAGLVSRHRDRTDRRLVRLRLTRKGTVRLARLSAVHLEELSRLAPQFAALTDGLSSFYDAPSPQGAPTRRANAGRGSPSGEPVVQELDSPLPGKH